MWHAHKEKRELQYGPLALGNPACLLERKHVVTSNSHTHRDGSCCAPQKLLCQLVLQHDAAKVQ